jgi:hypothetical protein
MSEMTLFKSNKAALALLGDVQDNLTDTIAGSSGGSMNRRISIKGGVFREIINGKEVRVNEDRAMNVVLVNAAPVSRMFFAGTYTEGEVTKPTCWSSDTQTPDSKVPEEQRQAARCMDCKQNIRGSAASGEGRACRFQQRVAVMIEGQLDNEEIYQITLPSTSVFGDGEKGKMPLQAYGRYLKAHNTHAISIVTEMRFDTSSPTPKLVFKAVRPLEEDELRSAIAMKDHADTIKAITLNVSQMDGVIPSGEKKSLPPVEKKTAPKVEEPQEEVEEPKKVVKKTAAPVEEKGDLSDIVGDWDD